uniref:Uncharacterized protein n=1 Tax=Arundo donax TaxID=35708 RepID=A0A0A8Z3C4_ARUDO
MDRWMLPASTSHHAPPLQPSCLPARTPSLHAAPRISSLARPPFPGSQLRRPFWMPRNPASP